MMFLLDDDIKHKTNSIKGVNPIDNQPFDEFNYSSGIIHHWYLEKLYVLVLLLYIIMMHLIKNRLNQSCLLFPDIL